jgi:predicted glycosyltransferase
MSKRTLRICAYAHCRTGMGHIARTQRIVAALARYPDVDCTVITCRNGADFVPAAPGVRVLALPNSLPVEDPDSSTVLRQRAQLVTRAFRELDPDVFLVDHMLFGINAELLPIFKADADRSSGTRFVFGMPYAPYGAALGRQGHLGVRRFVARYDASLCYVSEADPSPWLAYRDQGYLLPDEHHHVGVVQESLDIAPPEPADAPLVVALAGGGVSGGSLFRLLLAALLDPLRHGQLRLRIIAGPMSDEPIPEAAAQRGVEWWPQARLSEALCGASAVVSRCGYNTALALMDTPLPVVLCPYITPSGDQAERAERLGRLDRVWAVREQHGPAAMAACVRAALASAIAPRHSGILGGGDVRAAQLLVGMARERVRQ